MNMKLTHKLTALILLSACAVSTTVNAQESGLEKMVASYVKGAVTQVSNDIDIQIEKSLLTASTFISIGDDELPSGKLKITDLVVQKKMKNESEVKKANQKDSADD